MTGMSQAGTTTQVRYSQIVTKLAWLLVWMLHRLVSFSRNFPRIGVITHGNIRGHKIAELLRYVLRLEFWEQGSAGGWEAAPVGH